MLTFNHVKDPVKCHLKKLFDLCIFSKTSTGQRLKAIKLLRVLRPLKTINRWQKLMIK